jgi:hypothetical protein
MTIQIYQVFVSSESVGYAPVYRRYAYIVATDEESALKELEKRYPKLTKDWEERPYLRKATPDGEDCDYQ